MMFGHEARYPFEVPKDYQVSLSSVICSIFMCMYCSVNLHEFEMIRYFKLEANVYFFQIDSTCEAVEGIEQMT